MYHLPNLVQKNTFSKFGLKSTEYTVKSFIWSFSLNLFYLPDKTYFEKVPFRECYISLRKMKCMYITANTDTILNWRKQQWQKSPDIRLFFFFIPVIEIKGSPSVWYSHMRICRHCLHEYTYTRIGAIYTTVYSTTVISVCWATVDWSWPKEWN